MPLTVDLDTYSSQPSFENPSLQRHSKYYFNDDLVIFKVENSLFRVHKHYLIKESEVFQSMFSCPPDTAGPEGCTEDKPIVLPEVKVQEFEALLDVFYERGYCDKEPRIGLPSTWFSRGDASKLDADEKAHLRERLQGLLSVADRFGFEEIKGLAIKALEKDSLVKLGPVDKIILAHQFDVSDWLRPAYTKLCQRSKPLSTTEAGKLGAETAALIAQAREMYRDSEAFAETKSPYNLMPAFDFSPAVARIGLDREADTAISAIFFPETKPSHSVDESGVDSKDIALVIQQTGCSRAKAVRVLRESSGDLINAIMAASD
ncbi:hypothetical protein MD484_g666, partial [Candolleomyces efflorescens]